MMGYTYVWKNDIKGFPSVNRKTIGIVIEIHKFLQLRQDTILGWHKEQRLWRGSKQKNRINANIDQSSHPTWPLALYIIITFYPKRPKNVYSVLVLNF